MHLLLLRHGQTDENARGILQGQSQTTLNAFGHEQAQLLAMRLRTYEPRAAAVVSSDLARARQTADVVASALGVGWVERPAWRERGFGPFEGRTIGEADVWRAANGHWDLPGAEPTGVFQERVRAALEELAGEFGSIPCVAVVTHGAVIRNILNLLADGRLPRVPGEPAPESVPIANCGIMHLEACRIDQTVAAWRVHGINDVDHLANVPVAAYRVEE